MPSCIFKILYFKNVLKIKCCFYFRDGVPAFKDLKTVDQFWSWSQHHMLDKLTWQTWQDGSTGSDHQAIVGNSLLIGRVSLRQLRVEEQACNLPPKYMYLFPTCRYGYSDGNAYKGRHYGVNETWSHVHSDDTRAKGVQGRHAYYDGSGYQVFLEHNRYGPRI